MTVKELKHNLALFPDRLDVKIECDGLDRDVIGVVCFRFLDAVDIPDDAKQYVRVYAEDKPDLSEIAHRECENMYTTPFHTFGRCNDDPEPVVNKDRLLEFQKQMNTIQNLNLHD